MYFCKSIGTTLYSMNQLRYTLLAALFAVAVFASGCRSDQQPSDVMGEEKMAEFLQEAYLLEGFYGIETSFQYDTLYPEMLASYDSLLASYSLTREDFERSIDWYTRHPQIYQRIHDTVLARFDRQLEEFGDM